MQFVGAFTIYSHQPAHEHCAEVSALEPQAQKALLNVFACFVQLFMIFCLAKRKTELPDAFRAYPTGVMVA